MACASIAEFYKNQSLFITGATGFMGKVLVEKLLRSCSGIEKAYLLLRPLPGKTVSDRLEDLIKNEVFDSLREENSEVFKKLVPVAGDISMTGLGLSLSDQQMLCASVTVVFHSAARIKFDDDLKSAIESNVKGPQKVAAFCRNLEKLKAFVHVSTAFNNLDKGELEEVIYPASLDPQKLIEFVECVDDKLLVSITKQLIGNCPNVYAYTKALGEQLLQKDCRENGIPLAVVRPSIVTASVKEPFPGWIDNLNGPSGLITGVGKGFIRTTRTNSKLVGDLIPVDIAINLMIASAWECAVNGREIYRKDIQVKVYNCASGSLNPLTWDLFNQYGMAAWKEFPTKDMVWYPSLNFCNHDLLYQLEVAIYHYIPAYFFDLIARMIGRKPIMVRLYDKIHRALSCIDFYVVREWKFVSNNAIQLLDKMSSEDRNIFYFDVRDINWHSYITNYILGCRRFLLKDKPDTFQTARRNLNRLYWLRIIVRVLLLGGLILFFYFLMDVLESVQKFDLHIDDLPIRL